MTPDKAGLPSRSSRPQPAYAQLGFGVAAFSRFASEGWWGKKDSNLRSHTAADLQSAPFATRDTSPSISIRNRPPEWRRTGPWMTLRPKARLRTGCGRRVYGRRGVAKSTKADHQKCASSGQIAIFGPP